MEHGSNLNGSWGGSLSTLLMMNLLPLSKLRAQEEGFFAMGLHFEQDICIRASWWEGVGNICSRRKTACRNEHTCVGMVEGNKEEKQGELTTGHGTEQLISF